jgi:hypothetical protein
MIRQVELSFDQPMEATAVDYRADAAKQAPGRNAETQEILDLRTEIRETEALVAHFLTTMGPNFFLTVQHMATLNNLRKELGLKLNGPETDAQRESRLDSEADEVLDQIAKVLMGSRNENALDDSANAADGRPKTIDELEAADDDFLRQIGTSFDSPYG